MIFRATSRVRKTAGLISTPLKVHVWLIMCAIRNSRAFAIALIIREATCTVYWLCDSFTDFAAKWASPLFLEGKNAIIETSEQMTSHNIYTMLVFV